MLTLTHLHDHDRVMSFNVLRSINQCALKDFAPFILHPAKLILARATGTAIHRALRHSPQLEPTPTVVAANVALETTFLFVCFCSYAKQN